MKPKPIRREKNKKVHETVRIQNPENQSKDEILKELIPLVSHPWTGFLNFGFAPALSASPETTVLSLSTARKAGKGYFYDGRPHHISISRRHISVEKVSKQMSLSKDRMIIVTWYKSHGNVA